MNGEEIIKLTNAVYKVTDLFPAKDPLRMATRKEALNVLFSSILFLKGFNPKNKVKALASLKVLEACFDVAQKQNWVNEKNFEILKSCLLYTSDAADDLLCVDLGGRRIIKQKKKIK